MGNSFGRLTIANVTGGDPILWLHSVLVALFQVWVLLVVEWHYKQFVIVRQHYLKGGGEGLQIRYWRSGTTSTLLTLCGNTA